MIPRSLLLRRLLLVSLLAGPALLAGRAQPANPPNVVLFFADDLGYGDLSSYGHPTIRTPHLDRLARQGIRLTSFYSAAPVCTPARVALLIGRYPLRSGMPTVLYPDSEHGLPASEITLAEALNAEGYQTMAIGKWHLGSTRPSHFPTAHGFDAYYGLLYSNDMKPPWVNTERPLSLYRNTEPVVRSVDQSTLTERYTQEAVQFIQSAEKPFFLYLPYTMPHLPLHTAERFRGQSQAGLYGDVIETIDWSAGRIMEALKKRGVARNTMVIFTSDNGPWSDISEGMQKNGIKPWHGGSAGMLRGSKFTTYEGGMRVPGIIRWPAEIPAGQESAEIATTMDLYTTIIEAAGGAVPDDRPVDGNNILPMLRGTQPSPTNTFFYFKFDSLQAVRQGPWKLRIAASDSEQNDAPVFKLYNLEVDPGEQYNRAAQYPDVVERLRARMRAFREEVKRP